MPRKRRDPFVLTLNPEETRTLVDDLVTHLEDAIAARSALDLDAVYWMKLYEQQRTRLAQMMPWPDAADLTSYLGTEKVDALHARLHRTIVGVEPIWSVEGWGEAASRAPIVEEFHQWKAEEERLQGALDRVLLLALIEPVAVLEVSETTETRLVRERKAVALELDPETGGPMLDAALKPIFARDDRGNFRDAQSPEEPQASVVVDSPTRIRKGPAYKVIPFRDFYMLPGHARDDQEVWGYAKRFYRRMGELKALAETGIYDRTAVESLPEHGERPANAEDVRSGVTVIERTGDQADKELWELLVLRDLDGKGERWYLLTVHALTRTLLRVQHDDLARKRFVKFVPLPRPDSVYGYSFIGEKLITVIEEHTAWRNVLADKAMMSLMSPIKRHHQALWDPDEVPLGPKAVIDVRDMNEVQPMQMPDLPQGALQREREIIQAAERLAGINDVALGTQPNVDRTLGEVQLVTEQSFVRMDEIVRRVQESLEDLFMIRHEIYKRTLAENPDVGQVPTQKLTGLEHRGIMIPEGAVTAEMLMGQFRGKPRGSVESADINRKRADFNAFIQALPALLQMWPMLQMQIQTPQAAKAMLEEMMRVYRFENRQAFLGPAQMASMPMFPMLGGAAGLTMPPAPQMPGMPPVQPLPQGGGL